jgi:hypothetical protein
MDGGNTGEAAEADAVEQRRPVDPADAEVPEQRDLPLEADSGDAADQRKEVGAGDEDDYPS